MLPVTTRVLARNEDKQTPLKREPAGGRGRPGGATASPHGTHLDVLHELPHVAVPVRGHVAVGLHVQHGPVAPPPPRVLLGQGQRRAPQVGDAGQPLQGERVVRLPAEGGRVVEEADAGRVREQVVVHGGLLVEQRPRLVGQAGQRRLVGPEVGAVEDERLGAAVPRHPPAARGQAGAPRAVDALRVPGEVREEAAAPPQHDGQRLVAPRVVVARPAVRRRGRHDRARWAGGLRPALGPARRLAARLPLRRQHPRAAPRQRQRQRQPEAAGPPPRPAAPHRRLPGHGRQETAAAAPPGAGLPPGAARGAAARGGRSTAGTRGRGWGGGPPGELCPSEEGDGGSEM